MLLFNLGDLGGAKEEGIPTRGLFGVVADVAADVVEVKADDDEDDEFPKAEDASNVGDIVALEALFK